MQLNVHIPLTPPARTKPLRGGEGPALPWLGEGEHLAVKRKLTAQCRGGP